MGPEQPEELPHSYSLSGAPCIIKLEAFVAQISLSERFQFMCHWWEIPSLELDHYFSSVVAGRRVGFGRCEILQQPQGFSHKSPALVLSQL